MFSVIDGSADPEIPRKSISSSARVSANPAEQMPISAGSRLKEISPLQCITELRSVAVTMAADPVDRAKGMSSSVPVENMYSIRD
jgi:hypothetical protein